MHPRLAVSTAWSVSAHSLASALAQRRLQHGCGSAVLLHGSSGGCVRMTRLGSARLGSAGRDLERKSGFGTGRLCAINFVICEACCCRCCTHGSKMLSRASSLASSKPDYRVIKPNQDSADGARIEHAQSRKAKRSTVYRRGAAWAAPLNRKRRPLPAQWLRCAAAEEGGTGRRGP